MSRLCRVERRGDTNDLPEEGPSILTTTTTTTTTTTNTIDTKVKIYL